MRTFTRSLLMFLLLLASGTVSAQDGLQLILERDYTTTDSYPYYWMGDSNDQPNFCSGSATVEIVDGALRIENTQEQSNNWDLQPFVLDWFNTVEGEDYVIRVWMKADVDGYANLSIGTWGTSGNATLEFQQSDEFKLYTVNHTAAVTSTGNDEHILWQMGKTIGVVYIQKIQILKPGDVMPPLSEYGIWKPLIINSDMEGESDSCFYAKIANDPADPVPHAAISNGVGVDDSRGILVEATEKVKEAWDNQFWFRFTEPVESGTKYRVKFDYKADQGGAIATQAHAEPGDYIHYDLFGNIEFSDDWQTYEKEGQVTSQQSTADKKFQSVAFNLNDIADANNYYFDNIYFDIYKPTVEALYSKTCIRILFPYYTNIIKLVKKGAQGKKRLMMPTDCITVKVNGEVVPLMSVEADLTGELYVFFDESWEADGEADVLEEEETELLVSWNKPEDETYLLLQMDAKGVLGDAVEFADVKGHYDEEDQLQEVMSYLYGAPEVMSSDPEEGSFNLPATIKEFKVVFDKKADCARIKAKLDNEALTIEPAEGFATEIILKRTGTANLADGEHTIYIDKIYGEVDLGDEYYSTGEIKFSTGKQVSEELMTAIAQANETKTANEDEKYAGEAFNALSEAIAKYEAEVEGYTAPSVIDAAIIDLSNLVKAMTNHHDLVDTYIDCNDKVQGLAEQYAESKFNTTPLYLQLKATAEKYAGKNIILDDELTAANAELKPLADLCGNMFTEGESNDGDAGYKVLTDRIRRGMEALKVLGVSESDSLMIAASNAISDDENIATALKNAITKKTYEAIKANKDDFFGVLNTDMDEETGEEITTYKSYDMSVFIKNPNMYTMLPKNGFTAENMPGWTVVKGNPGFYGAGGDGWGNPRNIEGLPEDIAVTVYHAEAQFEQTITDLPAGMYTVTLVGTDWGNQKGDEGDGPDAAGFVYAKTSETVDPEAGEEADREVNFAGTATIEYAGQYRMDKAHNIKDIVVTDGQLTIGVYYGNDSQYFFGNAKLTLTGAATDFDYAKALQDIETNIDAAKSNKVRAIQLFDLNGRSINKAQKGIVIVKKVMSDGTIKTEKVVK